MIRNFLQLQKEFYFDHIDNKGFVHYTLFC